MKNALIILLVLITVSLSAFWERTNGPDGGYVNKIVRKDNFLFSATGGTLGENGSVYRSSDNGETWDLASYSFNINYGVLDLAVNDEYIFAGTKGFGIYRSADNGENWDHINVVMDLPQINVKSLYADNEILVLGTMLNGTYISYDNGESWNILGNVLTGSSARISGFIRHDSDFYISTEGGIFKLVDDSWVIIENIADIFFRDIITDGTYIYITGIQNSYRLDPQTMEVFTLTIPTSYWIYSLNNTIFASEHQTLYFSNDFGENWELIELDMVSSLVVSNSFYAEEDFWIISNGMFNLFKSTDNGENWYRNSKGISNITVNDFAFFNNKLFAVTEFADFGRIFASENSGEDWYYSENGTDQIGYFSVFANDEYMLAGSFGAGMYRSDDGENWSILSFDDFPTSYPTQIIEHNDAIYTGVLGFSIDVYQSLDSGNSFQALGVPGEGDIYTLHSYDEKLYYGRTDNVYFSDDNGSSWNILGNGFQNLPFIKVIEDFNNNIYVVAGTIVNKLNENNDWVQLEIPNNPWVVTIKSIDDKLLIGTKEDGIYEMDLNENIIAKNENIPVSENNTYPKIMKFFNDDEFIYVSAEMFGVFKTPLEVVGNDDIETVYNPNNVNIYPNPFSFSRNQRSSNITISFNIEENSEVELELFNILGQKVNTIFKGELKKGNHNINWNGESSDNEKKSSGIYFLRADIGKKTSFKKVVFLR